MKTKYRFRIVLIALMSTFLFSLSWASGTGRVFVLESTPKHPHASGTAVIADDHINLQSRGLNPEAVYTVWFVNMKPKKSATGYLQSVNLECPSPCKTRCN